MGTPAAGAHVGYSAQVELAPERVELSRIEGVGRAAVPRDNRVERRPRGLSVQRDGEICFVRLTPGRHHITARNADLGEDQKTFVIVHSN